MEETSTRLPGTVSSDLDATYAIPDGPRGMLLGHCPSSAIGAVITSEFE